MGFQPANAKLMQLIRKRTKRSMFRPGVVLQDELESVQKFVTGNYNYETRSMILSLTLTVKMGILPEKEERQKTHTAI